MQIVLATRNQGKVAEIREMLAGLPVEILSLDDAGVDPKIDVEEYGNSFEEIAANKAKDYAKLTNLPTLADDSGLCIKALDGAPGIHSKRFVKGDDHTRNLEVLKQMEGQKDRSAYFITVLCLYDPATSNTECFEGRVDGVIIDEERGIQGFGYDPIFAPTGHTKTFAELGVEVKNTLSHRGFATQKLAAYLANPKQNGHK